MFITKEGRIINLNNVTDISVDNHTIEFSYIVNHDFTREMLYDSFSFKDNETAQYYFEKIIKILNKYKLIIDIDEMMFEHGDKKRI